MIPPVDVFVLMPFGSRDEYKGGSDESDYIYDEIVKPGVFDAVGTDAHITREADESKPGSITTSIVRKLARATIVIVDITGWNPNVFFELGIRYALRDKVTLVIAQRKTVLPFDIASQRVVWYNRFKPRQARASISEAIRKGRAEDAGSDSIVFDTFREITVRIPGVLESHGSGRQSQHQMMTWDDYMSRINGVVDWLGRAVNNGDYVPNAMLGISNGGLIAADLIGKAVFAGKSTPVLGLWARRYTQQHDYFDNPYNEALARSIRAELAPKRSAALLLVDDHFGTGNTATQAINFLRKHLGNGTRVIYVPLATGRREHVSKIEEFLPYSYRHNGRVVFDLNKEDYLASLYTDASYLPYFEKQINRGLEQIKIV